MSTLRICIGCEDGERIASTHMGDTRQFLIYDIPELGEMRFVETRRNTAVDMDHAQHGKMRSIIGILSDVDVFVAARNSPNFRRIAAETRYQPVVVDARTVEETLDLIRASFGGIMAAVVCRREGDRETGIPELRRKS
ncbi:MAG TPA: hypothetical protein ENO23_07810 [Alphaproteobacteria bacterium]|nr:hypothetical protein [Alphaproteobacteria bacterium]